MDLYLSTRHCPTAATSTAHTPQPWTLAARINIAETAYRSEREFGQCVLSPIVCWRASLSLSRGSTDVHIYTLVSGRATKLYKHTLLGRAGCVTQDGVYVSGCISSCIASLALGPTWPLHHHHHHQHAGLSCYTVGSGWGVISQPPPTHTLHTLTMLYKHTS